MPQPHRPSRRTFRRISCPLLRAFLLSMAGIAAVCPPATLIAEETTAVEARLLSSAQYLSSDELEGRGVGTKGLDLAADYIAAQFAGLGLKTELFAGEPFQRFHMTTGAMLGEQNTAALVGPRGERIELKLGGDFNPLTLGGSGEFDLPLVFVGYGITGKDEMYDDYEGLDVEDKAVVILRREPQQDNPHSVFDGTRHSQHAPFARKVSNAYEHGAAAVIFVTDEFDIRRRVAQRHERWLAVLGKLAEAQTEAAAVEDATLDQIKQQIKRMNELTNQVEQQRERLEAEFDPVLNFEGAGGAESGRDFPVLHSRREVIDRILRATHGTTLSALETAIDEGPTPHSRELTGWRLVGRTDIQRQEVEVKNVVAMLEGDGSHGNETVVIGAHYDHLGYGGPGSFVPDKEEIHNGADDNASGTATLIEVARRLASRGEPLPRRVLFIAFTGEERGLVGSAHYVANPLVPNEDVVAMLNMDMVGRLEDDKLIVHGTGTSPVWDAMIDQLADSFQFTVTKQASGTGPSDHTSFYTKQIPVLHFFTGTHSDYHRPSDTAEKLNVEGMRRIGALVSEIAERVALADARPEYRETASSIVARGGDRPYFGSIPDFSVAEPGYALSGVTEDSPAAQAGLKSGDLIVRLGESRIGNLEDFDSALRKYKAGDEVPVVVKREGQEVTLKVTLGEPREFAFLAAKSRSAVTACEVIA